MEARRGPRHSSDAVNSRFGWGGFVDDPPHDGPPVRSSFPNGAVPPWHSNTPSLRHDAASDAPASRSPQWPAAAAAPESPATSRAFDAVAGWWDYQRLMRGTAEERRALEAGHPARTYQSWIEVNRRISQGGPPALDLVVSLIDAAPSYDHVALVGAGPLEDLVRKHGNGLADQLANLADRHPGVGRALTCVLARGVLSDHAARRLAPWIS